MNKTIYIPLFLAILLTACCKEKVYKLQPLTAEMASIYQEGNWWKYANQDSSLIDCVYVYSRASTRINEDCQITNNIYGVLESDFLFKSNNGYAGNYNFSSSKDGYDYYILRSLWGEQFRIKTNQVVDYDESPIEFKSHNHFGKNIERCLKKNEVIYSVDFGYLRTQTPNPNNIVMKIDTFYLVETNLW